MPTPIQINAGSVFTVLSDRALNFMGDPYALTEIQIEAISGAEGGDFWTGAIWTATETWINMTAEGEGVFTYIWDSIGTLAPGHYLIRIREDGAPSPAAYMEIQHILIGPSSDVAQVTLRTQDALTMGLGGTRFTIRSGAIGIFTGTMDGNGDFSALALEAGTYTVLLYRTATSFTVPETIVVTSGGPNTFTFTGTSSLPGVPADPSLCRVYGDLMNLNGAALATCQLVFQTNFDPVRVQDRALVGTRAIATTDANGHFEIDLVQGAVLTVSIIGTNIVADLTIPATASADILDLLGAAADRFATVAP